MLNLWWVEIEGDYTDFADCLFRVSAKSYKEAWRKAVKLEPNRKIIRIYQCLRS
jgi:hypothetical protein